jgi:hypothetical protein
VCGVGRGLGVTLGVAVGRGVEPGVGVTVGVGVGCWTPLRAISPAGIEIRRVVSPAPDNHLTAGPDCRG